MDGRFGAQQFEQAFGGAGGAHQVAPHFGERAHAAGDQGGIENERSQFATAHLTRAHLIGAHPQHKDNRAHHRSDDQRGKRGAHPGAFDCGGETGLDTFGVTAAFALFLGIGLDCGHGVEHFAGQCRGIGDSVLGFA